MNDIALGSHVYVSLSINLCKVIKRFYFSDSLIYVVRDTVNNEYHDVYPEQIKRILVN